MTDAPQHDRYTSQTVDELYSLLQTSPSGLTPAQAAERMKTYGLNELEKKKRNPSSSKSSRP